MIYIRRNNLIYIVGLPIRHHITHYDLIKLYETFCKQHISTLIMLHFIIASVDHTTVYSMIKRWKWILRKRPPIACMRKRRSYHIERETVRIKYASSTQRRLIWNSHLSRLRTHSGTSHHTRRINRPPLQIGFLSVPLDNYVWLQYNAWSRLIEVLSILRLSASVSRLWMWDGVIARLWGLVAL